jgi:hypothetical protein
MNNCKYHAKVIFLLKKECILRKKTFIKRVNLVNIGFLAQELPKVYSQFHIKHPALGGKNRVLE